MDLTYDKHCDSIIQWSCYLYIVICVCTTVGAQISNTFLFNLSLSDTPTNTCVT